MNVAKMSDLKALLSKVQPGNVIWGDRRVIFYLESSFNYVAEELRARGFGYSVQGLRHVIPFSKD